MLFDKRGEWDPKTFLFSIIIGVLVLLILLSLIGDTSETNKKTKELVTCNIAAGNGVCRESCLPEETIRIKNFGCPVEKNSPPKICCINPDAEEEEEDINYRFDVFDIGLDDSEIRNRKCKDEGKWTYTCNTGNIRVKMTVKNTGSQAIPIFANPQVNSQVGSAYPVQGNPVIVNPDKEATLTATLNLERKKSYTIKAAAKCNTGPCKEKFGNEGIFKLNDRQYITVTIN